MGYLDQLTYDEKVALEGELSLAFYLSLSKEDMAYKAYLILKNAKEDLKPFLAEGIAEISPLSEETLQKILIEISMNSIPKWIWLDKAIQDIKDALTYLSTSKGEGNIACLDKSEAKKRIISSAFITFIRKVAMKNVDIAIDLCKRIIRSEQDLDFLAPICIKILDDLKGIRKEDRPTKEERAKVMDITFDVRDTLSFSVERKARELINSGEFEKRKKEERKIEEKIKDSMIKELRSFFETPVEESELFIVQKKFKGSNAVCNLKTFATLEEAEQFVEELETSYPELLNTCSFEILKKEKEKRMEIRWKNV